MTQAPKPLSVTAPMDRLAFERSFWEANDASARLAGVDEAGRGCLAGPVVAGAVEITWDALVELATTDLKAVNDSKQLSAKKREALWECLTHHHQIRCAVGIASVAEIDEMNILNATHLAMRRAVENLPALPSHALVDGLPVKHLPISHTPIVKGDAKSLLIGCASIIAKVTRDHLCLELERDYPGYGFAQHKAYCTKAHLTALRNLGPCPAHRRTFSPVAILQEEFHF